VQLNANREPLEDLLNALNLTDLGENPDTFEGPSQWMPHGRVFGGQVLAQCLIAAQRTIDNRPVHSLHGYFLRAGDINQPITFAVDRLRDGRSFSTRRVQAFQNGEAMFSMIASFQVEGPGIHHQDLMPAGVAAPETLPSAYDVLGEHDHPMAQFWAKARPFDIRHVDGNVYVPSDITRVAHQATWFKANGAMPDDQLLHRAAIAYASDYSILEPIFRRHALTWAHKGLSEASLDHAMWFHRDARADEWLLYVTESPSAQGGRGLATGRIFTREGVLVATVAQEGMIRIPEIGLN
jgi:acyl-CoA thioesterase-2